MVGKVRDALAPVDTPAVRGKVCSEREETACVVVKGLKALDLITPPPRPAVPHHAPSRGRWTHPRPDTHKAPTPTSKRLSVN